MICGPYDTTMARTASKLFYFFVEDLKSRKAKRLKVGYTGLEEGLDMGDCDELKMVETNGAASTHSADDGVGRCSSSGGGGSSSSSLSGSSDSTVPDDDGGGDSARNERVKNELLRIDALFVQLRDLIEKNANGHDNIDLSTSWRRKVTHLDATLESLRHRLAKWARAENVEAFCGKIRRLLEQHFCKS